MDVSPGTASEFAEMRAIEQRKAMMRDLVFGLALEPSDLCQGKRVAGDQ